MSCFEHPSSYFHLNDEETFEPECWMERRRQIRQTRLRLAEPTYVRKFDLELSHISARCFWPGCEQTATFVHIAGTEAQPALIDLCLKHHRKGVDMPATRRRRIA